MLDSIEIRISNKIYIPFVLSAFDQLRTRLFQTNLEPVKEALQILLNNVIEHAFEQSYEIDLRVRFLVQSCELRIDVEDNGLPFDFTPYLSQELSAKYEYHKGLYRIYQLVDRFEYAHLGKDGKCLSLIQDFNLCYDLKSNSVSCEPYDKDEVLRGITIRRFQQGDGDGIAKLIYRNYNFSYYKDIFYIPHKVREANLDKSVTSIVAYYKGEVIGHFALLKSKYSNIAEIGVATVDPRFKRMGIMNLMFDELILTAKKENLSAIYGEALTMHPYSQKANLRHNMIESAISIGIVPASMEIEESIKTAQKSGAMIAYLLFDPSLRSLYLPQRYKDELLKVYKRAGLDVRPSNGDTLNRKNLTTHINTMLNSGVIVIEDVFDLPTFLEAFEHLRHQKLDMIFADINLQRIAKIDTLISVLNSLTFFYGGLLFEYYYNEDYLRLQYVNSIDVDMDNIICYSDDANAMMDFIREDYKDLLSKRSLSAL
jgi:anti-sigma regulatory factor (Ser/Thr protein kinase)/N-acetylglutamate synthase-like GNAT family acetyltransferase